MQKRKWYGLFIIWIIEAVSIGIFVPSLLWLSTGFLSEVFKKLFEWSIDFRTIGFLNSSLISSGIVAFLTLRKILD